MKNYVKEFFKRGLMFAGFGPVVVGIIYLILSKTVEGFTLNGVEVFTSIVSIYLLAFVHAGASVFNQIDHWPLMKSLLCHFSTLYLAYVLCYLINSWIPFDINVVLIFTAVFVVVYFVVWVIVVLSIKAVSRKMNNKLS
ncbi:MAG: DUF3021 domain-containing protein [Clostridia bacterium]|nr:DUF3021 domain-containing protein [Clostridia bacterium]